MINISVNQLMERMGHPLWSLVCHFEWEREKTSIHSHLLNAIMHVLFSYELCNT